MDDGSERAIVLFTDADLSAPIEEADNACALADHDVHRLARLNRKLISVRNPSSWSAGIVFISCAPFSDYRLSIRSADSKRSAASLHGDFSTATH